MSQSESGSAVVKISEAYDKANIDLDKLNNLLNAATKTNYDQLEHTLDRKDLLQLHTHLMYALQSLTYMYAGLNGK